MIKRLAAGAILSVALVAGLAGCADGRSNNSNPPSENVYLDVDTVDLPDGRTVICVTFRGAAIDCDFDNPVDGSH